MIGRTLGHYKILELLGRGGMGEVYLAEDTKLQRRVALKVLSGELAGDADRRQRFEREARAAAQLNHPNIVTIHSVEEVDGIAFLTLELVEGRTLADVIPEGGLPLDRLLPLAIPLADAVGAAHQRGITHRDLKPANVMVTSDNRVKVLDFGLAKLREELSQAAQSSMPTQELTGEGRIIGTVAYMSPEQAEGRTVDPRSDVFSLGIMLYEMATGRRPFTGDTQMSVLSAILKDAPPSVSELRQDLPREFARAVRRCLAKDPEDRYQTAKDLRNDLRALREDLASGDVTSTVDRSGGADRSGGSGGTDRSGGSHRSDGSGASTVAAAKPFYARPAVIGGGAVVVVLIAAALYFGGAGSSGGPASAPAVDPFSSITLNRLTTTGTAGVAAISNDGRYAAYVVTENRQQSLWLRQVTTSSNVQIVPPADVTYDAVSFTPDGNYVNYVNYPRNANIASLYQVPVLGGGPRRLVEDIDTAPTYSPDGKQFAFLRGFFTDGSGVMIADAAGANARELMRRKPPTDFILDGLAWSPDGRTIAASAINRETQKGSVVTIDATSGEERTLGTHDWRRVSYIAWVPDGSHLLVNAVESSGESSSQLFSVSYPDGAVRRITNDLSEYSGLSLSADGSALVTVRQELRSRIWAVPDGNMEHAQQITAGAGTDDGVSGLAWMPDGRIVYASSTSGNLDIWIMDAAGSNRVQLTSTPQDDMLPLVTPDGKSIVFVSERDGMRTLFRMGADGSSPTTLGAGRVAYRPVMSFDGQWVYYSGPEQQNFRIPVAGGTPEPLLAELTAGGRKLPPAFHEPMPSPDGRAVAGHYQDPQTSGERIAVLSMDSATPERLFPNVGASARWAPDGRSLLFVSRGNLLRQPIGGGTPTELTRFTGDNIFFFAVSADQKRWALVRGEVASDVVLISKRSDR